MALDPVLLAVLACPNDKQPLYYFDDEGWLYNPRLRLRYRVDGEIPILLPDAGETLGQEDHDELMAIVETRGLRPTGTPTA